MSEEINGIPSQESPRTEVVEEAIYIAPPLKLMWWRFRKHKMALISAFVIIIFYILAMFPEFFRLGRPAGFGCQIRLDPPTARTFI